MSEDRAARISRRAYELWEQEGGGHGRHEDHWHRAADEIDAVAVIAAPDGTTLTVPVDEPDGNVAADQQAAKPKASVKPATAKASPKRKSK